MHLTENYSFWSPSNDKHQRVDEFHTVVDEIGSGPSRHCSKAAVDSVTQFKPSQAKVSERKTQNSNRNIIVGNRNSNLIRPRTGTVPRKYSRDSGDR